MSKVGPLERPSQDVPPDVSGKAQVKRAPGVPNQAKGKEVKGKTAKSAAAAAPRREDEGGIKRGALLFLGGMGVFMIGGGAALTWVAVHTGLQDFFIIGPGSMGIGCILLIAAISLAVTKLLRKRRIRQDAEEELGNQQENSLLKDYHIPQEGHLDAARSGQPVETQLYGKADLVRAHRVSVFMNDTKVAPIDQKAVPIPDHMLPFYEKELGRLPPPAIAFPQSISEDVDKEGAAYYSLPMKDRGKPEGNHIAVSGGEKQDEESGTDDSGSQTLVQPVPQRDTSDLHQSVSCNSTDDHRILVKQSQDDVDTESNGGAASVSLPVPVYSLGDPLKEDLHKDQDIENCSKQTCDTAAGTDHRLLSSSVSPDSAIDVACDNDTKL